MTNPNRIKVVADQIKNYARRLEINLDTTNPLVVQSVWQDLQDTIYQLKNIQYSMREQMGMKP